MIIDCGGVNMKTKLSITDLRAKIYSLTDRNYHTESVLELAKFLGDERLVKVLKHIMGIHEAMGHMPSKIYDCRHEILEVLLNRVEKELGIETRNLLYGAF